MSAGGKVHRCCHLVTLAVLLVVAPQPIAHAGFVHRRLLQSPSPLASIGPDQVLPGFSVEAILDLWGVGLLPFGLEMQQTLLNVLNATVTEADRDELQLLAVEELLPLSGPSSVTINSNRASSRNAQAPESSSAPASGRRLLLEGSMRRLLQVLAQAGNSDNLVNLPHLEVKVRIATSPGSEDTIVREMISAVDGPVLPMLNEQGVNVSFIQLTDTGLSYGNGTSAPGRGGALGPRRPPGSGELSATAIGLIVAAAVVVGAAVFAVAMFAWWRQIKAKGELQAQGQKVLSNVSHTSVQADSIHATSPSPSLGGHQGLLLLAGGATASLSHSSSVVSSRSSQQSSKNVEGEASQMAHIAGLDTAGYSVPFSELQFSRVIGEGSFGRVYLGKWREITVAIKILNSPGGPLPDDSWDLHDLTQLKDASWSVKQQGPSFSQQMLIQELAKEAALMAGLRHPNIVMFLGTSMDPPCMVTEFCARGSLLDVLHRARTNKAVAMELDWRRRLRLLLDAAKGMFYLHSRQPPVLHRDLKSANLLVDKHWQVKVADFNLSRVMQPSAAVSSLAATNPRWLPPEVLSGNGYGAAADVYAFGIIMWELLTWQVPWEGETPWQVVIAVVDRDQRPQLPPPESLPGGLPAAGSQYLTVMRHCWATKAEDRPTYAEVINDVRSLIDVEDLAAMERLNAASDNGSVALLAGDLSSAH